MMGKEEAAEESEERQLLLQPTIMAKSVSFQELLGQCLGGANPFVDPPHQPNMPTTSRVS
jgi:hypothetical protein